MKYLKITMIILACALSACSNEDSGPELVEAQVEPICCGIAPIYRYHWYVPGKEGNPEARVHDTISGLNDKNSTRSYFKELQIDPLNPQCLSDESTEPMQGWVSEVEIEPQDQAVDLGEIQSFELQLFEGNYQVVVYKNLFNRETNQILSREIHTIREGEVLYQGTNQLELVGFGRAFLWVRGDYLSIKEENKASIGNHKEDLVLDVDVSKTWDEEQITPDGIDFLQFEISTVTNEVRPSDVVEALCID